jgi:signal peptidase I
VKDGSTNREPLTGWPRFVLGRSPKFTLIRLGVTVLLSVFLFTVVFIPIRVTGTSMEPTYRDGQINLVNKLAYRRHPPQRGDVVGIPMQGERALLLKRVIGLPGERVAVRQGEVEINGQPLAEPYLKRKRAPWNAAFVLGPDDYWVVGDNRAVSVHGAVKRWEIAGKAVF